MAISTISTVSTVSTDNTAAVTRKNSIKNVSETTVSKFKGILNEYFLGTMRIVISVIY